MPIITNILQEAILGGQCTCSLSRTSPGLTHFAILEAIIQMKLPLGSKLNVNELQNQIGVSCTPIREAINRLQQEGLVVYENNVGAHIISLEPHDVVEIQQLAMTLHCAAIRLAMVNGDRDVIVSELKERLEEYVHADNPHDEVMAQTQQTGSVHRQFAHGSIKL